MSPHAFAPLGRGVGQVWIKTEIDFPAFACSKKFSGKIDLGRFSRQDLLLSGDQKFPSVMVAEEIDTVPPVDMADAKLSDPLPTAASPSMMTVETAPLAAVFKRKLAGVPDANPAADVIVLQVSSAAVEPGASGLLHARDASLVPGSALNVPLVLPAGAPLKISRNGVVPAAVVKASSLAFLVTSL